MRLIDADSIPGISTHSTGNEDYDKGYSEGAVRVLKAIDNAPTIDAIPIEWLREFDLYYAGISGGTPYMNELVKAWQRTGGIA